MLTFFFSLFLIISLFFLYSTHPLLITIYLTLLTIFIAYIIFYMSSLSWLSYILIIIFLSGIIIIIIYITTLASNEIISKTLISTSPFILITILPIVFNIFYNNNLLKIFSICFYNFSSLNDIILIIYKIYSPIYWILTFSLIIYLLYILIIVVKNSYLLKGPLQTKN